MPRFGAMALERRSLGKARGPGVAGTLVLSVLLVSGLTAGTVLGLIEPGLAALMGAGWVLVVVLWREGREARRNVGRLSNELSALSARVLRLEAQGAVRPAPPTPETHGLSSLSDDIGVLGGAMRTLADAMSEQEREIAGLKSRLDAPSPPIAADLGLPSVVPSLFRDPPPTGAAPGEPAKPVDRDEALAVAVRTGALRFQTEAVMALPQRRPLFLALSARLALEDGTVLEGDDLLSATERLGLGRAVDDALVARACDLAQLRPDAPGIAVRLSGETLRDRDAVLAICERAATLAADRVLLETPRRAWSDVGALTGLALLASRRIPLLLDEPADAALADPVTLARSGVRFARLGLGRLLRDVGADDPLPARLARAGIDVIATAVNREPDVPELIDLGVAAAQGALFGRPSPVADVPAAPAPIRATAPPPASQSAADEIRSLRSVVRRAG